MMGYFCLFLFDLKRHVSNGIVETSKINENSDKNKGIYSRKIKAMDQNRLEPKHSGANGQLEAETTLKLYKSVNILSSKKDFDELMKNRVDNINKVCKQIESRKKPMRTSNFFTLPLKTGSLTWCPVFKASSSNWLDYIVKLGDDQKKKLKRFRRLAGPLERVKFVAPHLTINQLKHVAEMESSKKLIIVRHPFDRLLSAFRDKLERKNDWYQKLYGRKIVSKYRQQAIDKFSKNFFSAENNFGSPVPVKSRTKDYPSWWEFVQFVIDTSPAHHDEHWMRSSEYCSPCQFSFNYILQFRNIAQEEKFVLDEIDEKRVIEQKWVNKNAADLSKEELISMYFNLLDDSQIISLYNIYEDDFKLFGYQFQFRGHKLNAMEE